MSDILTDLQGHVGWIEINRPPHNFFDETLIRAIAEACETFGKDSSCRAIVLAARGKAFCAGGRFLPSDDRPTENTGSVSALYEEALRIYRSPKPIVASIQGAAVGGGFGLALVADFRVVAPEARFWANFVKLGIHPGFGISHTLPQLIGMQKAARLLYTARRLTGAEAYEWGIADALAPQEALRDKARAIAEEIAVNAPLAVSSVKATLRAEAAKHFGEIVKREWAEQKRLFQTQDHKEGVRAISERRAGNFLGK